MATPLRAAAVPRAAAFLRRPLASAPFVHRRPGATMQARLLRQAQRRLPGGAGGTRVVWTAAAEPSPEELTTASLPGQLGFPAGTLLGRRYEVVELLGQGSSGVTYRCKDTACRRNVAVKCLSLRSLRGRWKQLELFEREARVLQALEHPGIPRYLACFEQDTERDRAFFLVQEAVEGASLAAMARSSWRPDEAEVERIAAELLGTLRYLGCRQPPVVHRDVKPENIVVEGGKSGGKVYLIDSGSVQAAAATAAEYDPASGATVVGTFGFMAPGQMRGAASPSCDLYSLGATLLFLVSGRPPSSFPADHLCINFSSVGMGARLRALLEGLLEPAPEERMGAEEALEVLAGKRSPERAVRSVGAEPVPVIEKRPPYISRLLAAQRGPCLERSLFDHVDGDGTGPAGGTDVPSKGPLILPALWSFASRAVPLITVAGLTASLLAAFAWSFEYGWTAVAYLAVCWAVLLWPVIRRHFVRERITIDRTTWKVERQLALPGQLASRWGRYGLLAPLVTPTKSGPTAQMLYTYVDSTPGFGRYHEVVLQDREGNECCFGATLDGNHSEDHKWLRGVIDGHVGNIRDGKV